MITTVKSSMRALICIGWIVVASTSIAGDFRAGIATRIVTPDPLLPVSGGMGPSNPAKTKQGEITVRALVVQDGATTVAIVGADFLGFPSVLGNRVRAAVQGIPPENILIGVTHTHSAPDCYAFPDGKGGTGADLPYLERVCARMAEAIQEAHASMKPASLKAATGEARGKIAYNYYAPDLYDPRCHVLQFLGSDDKPMATLVNYAIHPEVIGNDRGICSPDLCGPLYDRIAAKGGGTAIFMNSAQGGMVTADVRRSGGGENNTWEECQRIGQLLADEALRIVGEAPIQRSPKLTCLARTVTFPIDSQLMRQVLAASPLGYKTTPEGAAQTQMNLINLGNTQILTIPGEALPNIGFYLKRKMRGEHNLLFGLTNDAFGYMLTKVDWGSFRRYDYVSRTGLGEMTGELLIEEALKFVSSAPAPEKLKP